MKAEQSKSARLNEMLLDALPHLAMLIRKDKTILAANRMAREVGARIGGYCWRDFWQGLFIPEEDKAHIDKHGQIPPGGTRCTFCIADELLEQAKPGSNPEIQAFGKIWDTYWIPLDEEIYLHYAIDVTERKMAEARQAMRFEILRTFHQEVSLKNICEKVVSLIKEHLKCAAIALRLKEGEDCPYFVNNGLPDDFVKSENYLLVHDEKGNGRSNSNGCPALACMCGVVIDAKFSIDKPFFTKGGSFWTNSTTDLLASTPEKDRRIISRNVCNQYGYESVALIPIKTTRANIGLLQISAKQRALFSPGDIVFLEELGQIIGLVIERKMAAEALRKTRDELEIRVRERTAELVKTNEALQAEISEREKGEQALSKKQDELNSLLANVNAIILEGKGNPSRITYIGGRVEQLLGYPKEQWFLDPDGAMGFWKKHLHPDDRPGVVSQCEIAIREGRDHTIEYRMISAQGREVWFHDVVTVEMDDGVPTTVRCVMVDVTERKQAEENLRWYQQRLRSLAAELALAEEQERHRIASELHDEVAQMLAAAKLKLQSFQNQPQRQGSAESVAEISELIEQAIQDMQSLVFDLSPPVLHELGFQAAVQWLTEKIQAERGIVAVFEDDGQPKPLAEDVRGTLFRAVRELLINIAKHAGAKKAKVSLARKGPNIQVRVQDDGTGFDWAEVHSPRDLTGGFGIFNVRERLDYCGGSFQLESEPGRGTRVTLLAPLNLQAKVS